MDNTITEMKNTPEGLHSRLNEAKEPVSELEASVVEMTAMEQNNEKRMKSNESVSIMGRTLNVPLCLDLG